MIELVFLLEEESARAMLECLLPRLSGDPGMVLSPWIERLHYLQSQYLDTNPVVLDFYFRA